MRHSSIRFEKLFLLFITIWISFGASAEFYKVAWGTGNFVGLFSMRWLILFLVYVLWCSSVITGVAYIFFRWEYCLAVFQKIDQLRKSFSWTTWILVILMLFFLIWFLQHTLWGVVFNGIYFRLLLWGMVVVLVSILLSRGTQLIEWKIFLVALILTSSILTIAVSLQGVTKYPFSLGWSEGNRLWDYSIRFGRDRYGFGEDQDIYVLLDKGRLLVGGLPFLIPDVTIDVVRLWVGLLLILPYFLAGAAAYNIANRDMCILSMITLWTFLFLRQGPIHSPLVLTAALTVFIWRKPMWLALPLIIYAGYFAQGSRFTWLFAPGIWIGMLELAGASLREEKLSRIHWIRAITLGLAGAFGGYLFPKLLKFFRKASINSVETATVTEVTEQITNSGVTPDFVHGAVTNQELLWYRLLPNPTYGTGILLGLLIAILPIGIFLVWLYVTKKWKLNIWQILAIIAPLFAFLVVGLVASTKIGGGGDLHNMDMFLIGVTFTAFIAWENGGKDVVLNKKMPGWVQLIFIMVLALPALIPAQQLRSYDYGNEISTLLVLTDKTEAEAKSFDMLPDHVQVASVLKEIQQAVDEYQNTGDILFMDQRQLLTFDYIQVRNFIPEYEKKVLMEEALSANYDYYFSFYKDIVEQRFSLIVTEPLRTPLKGSSFEFGEENNAWVEWVSIPVLCYYQEIQTYKEVNVMLLIPKPVPDDCTEYIPPKPVDQ